MSSDIITNVEKRTGTKLPAWYTDKIRNFTSNNNTLQKEIAAKFTEDFIVKELQSDWWISKQNQLLFIYCAIGYNYKQDFYTWDDWDNNRMSEFEKVLDTVENCQTKYKNEFVSYMQQRSADAVKEWIEATYWWLDNIIRFYNNYKKNPNNIKPEEIKQAKALAKRIIDNCKYYHIDYKAKLSKEVRDFYDIE